MRGVGSGAGRNHQILLVAPTENFRSTVSRIISRCGYSISTVASGEQALEWLREGPCDLLVAEAHLPGMSGLGLLYSLRDRGYSMPVILVAESLTERLRWIVSGMGKVHCLPAPVDLDHLKQLLASSLPLETRTEGQEPLDSHTAKGKNQ